MLILGMFSFTSGFRILQHQDLANKNRSLVMTEPSFTCDCSSLSLLGCRILNGTGNRMLTDLANEGNCNLNFWVQSMELLLLCGLRACEELPHEYTHVPRQPLTPTSRQTFKMEICKSMIPNFHHLLLFQPSSTGSLSSSRNARA